MDSTDFSTNKDLIMDEKENTNIEGDSLAQTEELKPNSITDNADASTMGDSEALKDLNPNLVDVSKLDFSSDQQWQDGWKAKAREHQGNNRNKSWSVPEIDPEREREILAEADKEIEAFRATHRPGQPLSPRLLASLNEYLLELKQKKHEMDEKF